ncbi:hypothetical protein BASA81_010041 [Batrachochytrium salamandrivorans]|nr:hypothetical protein BASA81_010041 [Batrachochytrium salamandrivorans]
MHRHKQFAPSSSSNVPQFSQNGLWAMVLLFLFTLLSVGVLHVFWFSPQFDLVQPIALQPNRLGPKGSFQSPGNFLPVEGDCGPLNAQLNVLPTGLCGDGSANHRVAFALSRRHNPLCGNKTDHLHLFELCAEFAQSHDSFVFAPPQQVLDATNHTQNFGLENTVTYEPKQANFTVRNPCFQRLPLRERVMVSKPNKDKA